MIIRRKEYPEFSLGDFKDLKSFFRQLKSNSENPLYQNLSSKSKVLIDKLTLEAKIKKSLAKALIKDFNRMIGSFKLYQQLVNFYGRSGLYAKLSERTKRFRKTYFPINNSTEEATTPQSSLRRRWLNFYTLADIYSEDIHEIRRKGVIRAWVEAILFAGLAVIFLNTFFCQRYRIPTRSMESVLKPGDKIFVSKLTYGPKIPYTKWRIPGFGKLERGDVVVFVPPDEVPKIWLKRKQFVKRLIGLPGEKVRIAGGDIFINGKRIDDPRIVKNYYFNDLSYGKYATRGQSVVVPEGKYFFLGDNSSNSKDSRDWGYADSEWIVGKAIFIWWPIQRIGKIE